MDESSDKSQGQDQDANNAKEPPPPQKTPVYLDPRKIKGDANDLFSLIYISIFFIVFIAIFVQFFMTESDVGTSKVLMYNKIKLHVLKQQQQQTHPNSTTFMNSSQVSPYQIYKHRTTGCGFYSAPSSIPTKERMLGLYSAKYFEEGTIVIDHMSTLPLDILHNGTITTVDIPSHLLLMRFHHSFCNVRLEMDTSGKTSTGRFMAIKPIQPGHELFFHMDDMREDWALAYQSIFPTHPNKNTFAQVDKVVSDVIAAIPLTRSHMGTNKRRKRVLDPAAILLVMKNTLLRYDETVAHLLPKTQDAAERAVVFGSALSLVHPHHSIEWVHEFGACVDGVSYGNSRIYAQRNVTQGNVIVAVPLIHILPHHPIDSRFHCMVVPDGNLCPIFYTSNSSRISETTSLVVTDSCPESESIENTGVVCGQSNARYEWSEKSPWKAGANGFVSTYFFDCVATQDIQEGEEILVENTHAPW